ncbi:MAG TPA: magnesium/cobalt transporter CorA [Terriglobales bacterium]|nr:magnesium/cobalt transporter CorA [Terriglobales bacterium]
MSQAWQPIEGLNWFDVDDPNSPALDELAARFGLHELQIEDCRHRGQRAKTEEYESYIFTVLKHLRPGRRVNFDDFDIFLAKDFLITVHDGECALIDRVRRRALERNRGKRLDLLFYLLTDAVVDEYFPLLDEVADATETIESEVLHRPEPPVLRRIFTLKRRLVEFRRVVGGMREVANAIIRREHGLVGDDLDAYFRDVYDHLVRTLDVIESQRDLLTGSLDIYLSAIANRTNEAMKVMTLYGTIALPLVIITGFFGMNLHLPWADHPYGAWYASGVMALSILLVLIYLRRKRWI